MRGIFPDIPGIPDIPDNVCSTPTSLPATMAMFDDALCYALQVLKKSHVSLKDEQRQSIWHAFHGRDVFSWLRPFIPAPFSYAIPRMRIHLILGATLVRLGTRLIITPTYQVHTFCGKSVFTDFMLDCEIN